MEIKWDKLSTDGLQGDLAKGVSGAYAALISGNLIVAGGANFPDKLGFEGGRKSFYNDIVQFDATNNKWKLAGHLPDSSAYGVSVPIAGGALWIGGNNASQSLNNVYTVSLSSNGTVELNPFPALPAAMDNFAGCSSGDMVFVGGGNVNGASSNAFYCINVKTDSAWTELPPFPGIPRLQPVMVSMEEEGKIYVYLLGGFFGGDETSFPAMATELLKYDVSARVWTKTSDQVDPDTQKPFSLSGATAMQLDNRYILCLGGVNYTIFLDAITMQYNIAHNPALSTKEKEKKNLEFSKKYMTQPVNYYRFNPECRVFDTKTGRWTTIDSTLNAARAGATLVGDGHMFYAVQGELKPGVRSPETWRGEIKIR
ncbi:MAG: Cyclically-permuted mutarotase family protein [Proteiniphilum sp.]|jgi:cyclically-permuted mutarotase family protein|nr:Cyclically-permuted mutarotase family protein [Proteiniphilum sp.]